MEEQRTTQNDEKDSQTELEIGNILSPLSTESSGIPVPGRCLNFQKAKEASLDKLDEALTRLSK